jgi:hypothetical protein
MLDLSIRSADQDLRSRISSLQRPWSAHSNDEADKITHDEVRVSRPLQCRYNNTSHELSFSLSFLDISRIARPVDPSFEPQIMACRCACRSSSDDL